MKPKSSLSLTNRIFRFLWEMVWILLFRPSPRIFHFWRRGLLRYFGAKVGTGCLVYPSARFFAPWNVSLGDYCTIGPDTDIYSVDKIKIGRHAVVSQYAFLCTAGHNISISPNPPLITGPINIEREAWVTAGAYVAPGVTVGEGAVAAAMSVVIKDVEPWTVVGGNPAKFIKDRTLKTRSP